MPSDRRLQSALDLARAVAKSRAADDWELEAIETGESGEDEPTFVLVLRLRWAEAAPSDPDELKRHIL